METPAAPSRFRERITDAVREHCIAGAWSLALALVLTWPACIRPGEAALGNVRADGMKHLWTLWWMRSSVFDEGRLPFQTELINHPVGMDLYPIEPLNGIGAVLLPWVSIVALSNLLVLFNLVLTGMSAAWMGRLLSGNRLGGLTSATLLMGSSVMAFFVHVGVGELLHLWWLPAGLACLIQARETLKPIWFLLLSGCLVLAMLSGFYLGFFLALAVSVWATATLWAGRQTPRLLASYALSAGLAVAVVWPVTQEFAASYNSGDIPPVSLTQYLFEQYGQPVTDPPSARLDPLELITPGRQPEGLDDLAYGGGRYLGLVALLLAGIGLVRQPRRAVPLVLAGASGVLFALGTWLVFGGEEVFVSGTRLRLPLLWLNRLLGYLAEPLNFPIRFLAITVTALAAVGSLALRSATPRRRVLLLGLSVLAVGEIQANAQVRWPWDRFRPRDASALEVLRDQPRGAVLDLALVVRADHENRWSALATQIAHGQATQAVPIERVEFFARDGHHFVSSLDLVKDLHPLYENDFNATLTGDYTDDFAILQDAGFQWLLVTYRGGGEQLPRVLRDEVTRVMGEPVAEGAGLAAWALPQVEVSPEQLRQYKAIHAEVVEDRRLSTQGGFGSPLR